jgi:hypothetical protein
VPEVPHFVLAESLPEAYSRRFQRRTVGAMQIGKPIPLIELMKCEARRRWPGPGRFESMVPMQIGKPIP